MAPVRIRFNPDALYEIRSSPGVTAEINAQLSAIAARANSMTSGTFDWESHLGRKAPQGRWRGTVFPTNFRARLDNQRHNILVKALGGGSA